MSQQLRSRSVQFQSSSLPLRRLRLWDLPDAERVVGGVAALPDLIVFRYLADNRLGSLVRGSSWGDDGTDRFHPRP
jgi:hypothetical protein